MKRLKRITYFVALAWTMCNFAWAQSSFDQANRLYEEGRYMDAIQAYQKVLTNQPTAALHFNLGNAYFKSGQLGEAIAEYRIAAAINPRDPDVQANLRFARAKLSASSYRPDWKERMAEKLTNNEWVLLSSAATWLFFVLLVTRQIRPTLASTLLPWTIGSAVLGVLLTTTCLWVAHLRDSTSVAVVVQRNTVLRLGPFDESKSVETLQDGTELKVLDKKNDWVQVTPGSKAIGWVTETSVRLVD